MDRLPHTRTLINESKSYLNSKINELEFEDQEAYKAYASKHSIQKGTKVTVGNKSISHGDEGTPEDSGDVAAKNIITKHREKEASKEAIRDKLKKDGKTLELKHFIDDDADPNDIADALYDNFDELFPDREGERDEIDDMRDEAYDYIEKWAEDNDEDVDDALEEFEATWARNQL